MIVLDASVLIALFDADDAQHERAVERLLATADQPLGASTVTLAEIYVGAVRNGRLGVARNALQELRVRELHLAADAAARLAALRAETGLKLPDCCVLLVAQDEQATIVTFDDRLARAADRLGLT